MTTQVLNAQIAERSMDELKPSHHGGARESDGSSIPIFG
jgi:hypothetical protein